MTPESISRQPSSSLSMPYDFALARENMVESDVRTNGVTDRRLIAAMRQVPRERFVPAAQGEIAYGGLAVPVGNGRFLLDPRSFSKLAEAAAIEANDKVLDIGGATGYSAAVLARLAGRVVALEEDETLARAAAANLAGIGAHNAISVQGPLTAGWPKEAPYDVIFLNGMVEDLPEALSDQLGDGGRLLCIRAATGYLGRAMLYVRSGRAVSGRAIFDATVPPLPGFKRKKEFAF